MKRTSFVLLTLAAIALTFGRSLAAETNNSEGTAIKVTGQAMVQLPGQSQPVEVTAGMKLPQGAVVTTVNGEVYIQAHTGTVAVVKSNSTVSIDELSVTTDGGKVTKETTSMNLRNGNLVSMLDPAKKSVNSYQVRTPKGVAAARGTTFTVSYNGVDYTIVATTGFVQITSSTGTVVSISGGQASMSSNGGAATAVGSLPADQKAEAVQAMSIAVATIAVAVENNMLGSGGSAQLADAAATVIKAEPSSAAAITQLVQVSAPSQNSVIEQAVRDNPPATPPATTPPPTNSPSTPETPQTTTPQPIDPSTISRSD